MITVLSIVAVTGIFEYFIFGKNQHKRNVSGR